MIGTEIILLASILSNPSLFKKEPTVATLAPEDFQTIVCGDIFRVMMALDSEGIVITKEIINSRAKDLGVSIDPEILEDLEAEVGVHDIRGYPGAIKTNKKKQNLQLKLKEALLYLNSDTPIPLDSILSLVESGVKECTLSEIPREDKAQLAEMIIKEQLDFEKGINNRLPGFGCGFDRDLTLPAPGELWIIAARPSMGKTMLAHTLADNFVNNEIPILFWGLEMTNVENAKRYISNRYSIEYEHLIKNKIPIIGEYQKALEDFPRLPIYFVDKSGIGVREIRSELYVQKQEKSIRAAIIDHGGLIDHKAGSDRNEVKAIGDTSKGLKVIAKELGICIFLIWQLSRDVAGRANKYPQLTDLRGSGRLEEDADAVVMVHWPGYYEEDQDNISDLADIFIRKHRSGKIGQYKVIRDVKYQKFREFNFL